MLLSHTYECLGNLWSQGGDSGWKEIQKNNVGWVLSVLFTGMASGLLFNVRVSILTALARVCKFSFEGLFGADQVDTLLDVLCLALKDEKFSVVRHEALEVLHAFLTRPESGVLNLSNLHFSFLLSQLNEMALRDKDGNVLRSVARVQDLPAVKILSNLK